MPGKLAAPHHSVVDWDFEHGATNRSLSNVQFVSPPTSLRFASPSGSFYSETLCRIPATLCLPQGEFRTWHYANSTSIMPCVFRNQASLGTSNHLNCYSISLSPTTATLWLIRNGSGSNRDSTSFTTFLNTWQHFRFFWYNGINPSEREALCVDLYREIAGEWVKQGSTLYCTLEYWKESAKNRVGFRPNPLYPNPVYYDDSEIWGPV